MITIEKEIREETAIKILNSAKHKRTSYEDLTNEIAGLDRENLCKKADIILVQILPQILEHYTEDEPFEDDSWRWHWSGVATGKYPLEKLPDHVRDLAKTLYYN